MMRMQPVRLCMMLVVLAGLFQSLATAQEPNVRMIEEPMVITESGVYRLAKNILVENAENLEAAIVIRAPYVTLDMGGYLLRSNTGGESGTGILVDGVIGTEISNGSVAMFKFNVVVRNSANAVVRNLRIRGNDLIPVAPPPEVGIMIAQSRNITVRENNIYNVGLGVFVRGGNSWGNRITQNTITAGRNGILGICYNPTSDDPRGPTGDLIDHNLISTFRIGFQASDQSVSNVVRDNTITFIEQGLELLSQGNRVENNTVFRMTDFTFNRQ